MKRFLLIFFVIAFIAYQLTGSIGVYVLNRSSEKQVRVTSMTIDGERFKNFYDNYPLPAKRHLIRHPGARFKPMSDRHVIEIWIQRADLPPERYVCKVKSDGIWGRGHIGFVYEDTGLKCGVFISNHDEYDGDI